MVHGTENYKKKICTKIGGEIIKIIYNNGYDPNDVWPDLTF